MTEKSSWWILSHNQERDFFIKGEIPWKSSERTAFFFLVPLFFCSLQNASNFVAHHYESFVGHKKQQQQQQKQSQRILWEKRKANTKHQPD